MSTIIKSQCPAHHIVGGGFTFVDLLPGKGTAGASISVNVPSQPASCDIFAGPSSLSSP